MSEWISVSERMPGWNEDILVSGRDGMAVAYVCGGRFEPSGVTPTYDMSVISLDIGTVTHWMPLPAPPSTP